MLFVGDGVNGQNPARLDRDKLLFVPPSNGESRLFFQSLMDPDWTVAIYVPGACKPSKYHVCFTPSGDYPGTYLWDVGDGPQPASSLLTLTADETYVLEIAGTRGLDFPLALSLNSTYPIKTEDIYSAGVVEGTLPLRGDDTKITFVADRKGPSTIFWGNTKGTTKMGGEIYIDGACYPSATHFCVTYDLPVGQVPPGRFLVDQGDGRGPLFGETLKLSAGTPYVFEITDKKSSFNTYPFALTESPNGTSATPLVEIDGVVSRRGENKNPAVDSGNQLVFTPPVSKGGPYFYQSTRVPNMGGKIEIDGACTPSELHICVSITQEAYAVNIGDLNGAVEKGSLILTAGKTYTFEVVGSKFAEAPFSLVDDNSGIATPENMVENGVSGDNPASGDNQLIVFTPPSTGARTYYYQSTTKQSWGGMITVLGTCISTKTHICISHDGKNPGSYFVTQGVGGKPVQQGTVYISAGENYTFEAVGTGFAEHPLALSPMKKTTNDTMVLTQLDGIMTDTTVAVADGDTLVFNPRAVVMEPSIVQSSTIFYESLKEPGLGGKIEVAGSCRPSEFNICVTVDDSGAVFVNYVYPSIPNLPPRLDNLPTGPVRYGPLYVKGGMEYTFEMVGSNNASNFSLSADAAGLEPYVVGVYGDNPLTSDNKILRWMPQTNGPEVVYFHNGQGESGFLNVLYTCIPGPTHICITYKEGTPGHYAVNHGLGAIANGELQLKTGETYTLEAAGPSFGLFPLALTFDPSRSATVMETGVSSPPVLLKDGDVLVFDTAVYAASSPQGALYYQCQNADDLGGSISLSPDFPVSPPTPPPTLPPTPVPPSNEPTPAPTPKGFVSKAPTTLPPSKKPGVPDPQAEEESGGSTTAVVITVVVLLLILAAGFGADRKSVV